VGLFLEYPASTDHKVIGLLYGFTSLFFLLVGFLLVLIIRGQLAYPGVPVPYVGGLLGEAAAPGGIILPEFYNQLGAMHGTIMVFLGVVPLAVGAFGNYLIPLQIGAPDMAFPRLNLASYWFYFAGGAVMLASFFVPGGAANNGWTSYAPLSDLAPGHGQTMWLVGMLLIIFSSLLGALNFSTTIIQLAVLERLHDPRAGAAGGFTPTQTGEWEIACSQLCGLGHYRMRGFYTIHTHAGYDAWLASEAALLAGP